MSPRTSWQAELRSRYRVPYRAFPRERIEQGAGCIVATVVAHHDLCQVERRARLQRVLPAPHEPLDTGGLVERGCRNGYRSERLSTRPSEHGGSILHFAHT